MNLPLLLANRPPDLKSFRFCTGADSVELIAAEPAQGDKPAGLPRFKMNVYNGGPMRVGKFGLIIIDLQGLQIPDRAVPVHRDHDIGKIVGHGESRIEGGRVWIEGEISGTGEAAREVVGNSRNGFPWQASIEADPLRVEEIKAGAQVQVNGRPVSGPITVIRRAELKGASFVSLGADSSTRAVAASDKEGKMGFDEFVKAKGFDPAALTEDQRKFLQAAYDAEQAAAKKDAAGDGKDKGVGKQDAVPPVQAAAPSAADEIKAERQRIAAIEAACKGTWSADDAPKVEEIRAGAVTEGLTVSEVNAQLLKLLRASRPTAGAPAFIRGGGAPLNARLLVAALCVANRAAVGLDDKGLVAEFGEQVMEGARGMGRARLTEVIEAAAMIDGITLPRFGRGSQEWVRAAFSSVTLTGILGAVANKSLLAAYQAVPPALRVVFGRGQVGNFQTHTRYRLTATGTFEKMGPAGELQHGRLSEQSYTQKADTYGRFFQLTRHDVVNDDLGAFLQIPGVLGRGWATAIEDAAATLLLANPSSFFAGGNGNYSSGAGSALGTAGLDAAVKLFLSQTDGQGNSVLVTPRFLVVPPALKALADRLYASQNLSAVASGLSSTSARAVEQLPDLNIYAGKYIPVCVPQLGNSGFSGYSDAGWYLFADPAALAAFEIAYLNGQDMPTIESVGVAPDTLGLAFRGYGDFGVAAVDPRGAVLSVGS